MFYVQGPMRARGRGDGSKAGEGSVPREGPKRLMKIGELMQRTGLSRQTVHNYTHLGLVTEEARTQSGHRLYAEEAVARLLRVKELRARMTLREIRDLFAAGRAGPDAS